MHIIATMIVRRVEQNVGGTWHNEGLIQVKAKRLFKRV